MKTNMTTPVATGSHNILINCLTHAEINPANIVLSIQQGLKNPPKHRTLREAIRYRIQVVQSERLIFLLTYESLLPVAQPVYLKS